MLGTVSGNDVNWNLKNVDFVITNGKLRTDLN